MTHFVSFQIDKISNVKMNVMYKHVKISHIKSLNHFHIQHVWLLRHHILVARQIISDIALVVGCKDYERGDSRIGT